jgi:hypothetical protein
MVEYSIKIITYILQMCFWKIYCIINNIVIDEPVTINKFKIKDLGLLYKVQRIYWTLKKFARRVSQKTKFSLKKHVVYSANEDLYGAPLVPKQTIELIQDNCIYKFSIHDLVRIIRASLLTIVHGYPCPKAPRNPYTNMEFDFYHLLSIYVFIWSYAPRLYYDAIISGYFKARFNLETFTENNRKLLSLKCVEAMVAKDVPVTDEIIADIGYILTTYRNPFIYAHISGNRTFGPECAQSGNGVSLSRRLNRGVLYKIFRPYLRLYYKFRVLQCDQSISLLKKALFGFFLYNPMFGRKFFLENKVYIDVRYAGFNECIHIYTTLGKSQDNMLGAIPGVKYVPLHTDNITIEKPVFSRAPLVPLVHMNRNDIYEPPSD